MLCAHEFCKSELRGGHVEKICKKESQSADYKNKDLPSCKAQRLFLICLDIFVVDDLYKVLIVASTVHAKLPLVFVIS